MVSLFVYLSWYLCVYVLVSVLLTNSLASLFLQWATHLCLSVWVCPLVSVLLTKSAVSLFSWDHSVCVSVLVCMNLCWCMSY